jgi:hypothetical protein
MTATGPEASIRCVAATRPEAGVKPTMVRPCVARAGWPQEDNMDTLRINGRPTSQWSRLQAGYSDDLGIGGR